MVKKLNEDRVKTVMETATVFEVTPDECIVEDYGRPCKPHRVRKLVRNWDQNAMQMPLLAELEYDPKTGKSLFAILDGQHRIRAFEEKHAKNHAFTAQIIDIDELTYEERGALYLTINNERKALTPIEQFIGRLEIEEEAAVTIYETLRSTGVKVGGIDKTIRANQYPVTNSIKKIESMYNRGTLKTSIDLIFNAYANKTEAHSDQAFSDKMLQSVDQIVYAFRHPSGELEYDEERLIDTIAKNPAHVWVTQNTIGMTSERKQVYAAQTILLAYNKNLPKAKQLDTDKVFDRNYNYQTRKAYGILKG